MRQGRRDADGTYRNRPGCLVFYLNAPGRRVPPFDAVTARIYSPAERAGSSAFRRLQLSRLKPVLHTKIYGTDDSAKLKAAGTAAIRTAGVPPALSFFEHARRSRST